MDIEKLQKSIDIIEAEGTMDISPEALVKSLEEAGLRESALSLQNWGVIDNAAAEFLEKASKKEIWGQTVAFLDANRKKKTATNYNIPKKVAEQHTVQSAAATGTKVKATPDAHKQTGHQAPPERSGSYEGEAVPRKVGVKRKVAWVDKDTGENRYKQVDSHETHHHVWRGGKWHHKKPGESLAD